MTFWAKLLTVIILVLSVLFAAASAILFAKKTEWRQKVDQVLQEGNAKIAQLNAQSEKLDNALATTKADRDQFMAKAASLQADKAALDDQVARLKIANDEKTKEIDAMTPELAFLRDEHKAAEGRYNTVRDEKEKALADASDLRDKLTASTKANQNLTEQNQALADNLQKTKDSLASETEQRKARDEQIAHLYTQFPNMRPMIDTFAQLEPRVNAKVLAIDEPSGVIILNVGEKAGVKKGFRFTVYRDSDFKGMIRIIELKGDSLAAGHIEYLAKDAQGNPRKIEMGDDAATAIGY